MDVFFAATDHTASDGVVTLAARNAMNSSARTSTGRMFSSSAPSSSQCRRLVVSGTTTSTPVRCIRLASQSALAGMSGQSAHG